MRSLIIGDIHDQTDLVDLILKENESKYEEVVFLGDYFDSFENGAATARKTAVWLKESIKKPNRIHLLGNHDVHYKHMKSILVRGSGYSRKKAEAVNEVLNWDDWNKLKPFYSSQGFIFSHAGFHQNVLHPFKGLDFDYFDKMYKENGLYSSLYAIGPARGGIDPVGGIFWLDWQFEFKPIKGINQVVGHTHSDIIRYKNYDGSTNVCADCLPFHVLEIIDGKLNEIKLN